MKFSKNLLLSFLISLSAGAVYGATITGIIKDAATGDLLPGANVVINTANPTGDATDLKGIFIIPGIPPGDYKLTITYIGYQDKIVNITLKPGEVTKVSIELEHEVVKGEVVVVTAQAAGQTAAINQQIRANNIKNIISADRIQEIPESSIAGAVRRLPGVSLRGDKTVIRGLSPHFNQIQIDGVDMASTSNEERSSGLGMISQYMVGGIELTKSAMADQEADVIGGTVNLIMKEAPDKPSLHILAENGYNTLSESFANPKFVLSGSKRFLNNLIGLYGQVTYEKGHGVNHRMNANYSEAIIDAEKVMVPTVMRLSKNDNLLKNRIGASLVLDYRSSLTKMKFSNFFATKDNKNTNYVSKFQDREIANGINFGESKSVVVNNAFKIEQYIGDYKLNAGASYSYASSENPEDVDLAIRYSNELEEAAHWNMPPIEIPDSLRVREPEEIDPKRAAVNQITYLTKYSENSQFSTHFDVQKDYSISDWMKIDLQMGGKYKHQAKEYDRDDYSAALVPGWSDYVESLMASEIDWIPDNYTDLSPSTRTICSVCGGHIFVDEDYGEENLLLGDYSLHNMPDMDRIKELHQFTKSENWYWHQMGDSYEDDYHGTEDYWAAYIMPQIDLFNTLTLIPGVRYEHNKTEYTSWRIPYEEETRYQPHPELANTDVTKKRKNEFFLPMIHAIYRPLSWFDVKASYTHTLSRPRFGDFIPKWRVNMNSLSYNNPYLKPALSKNIDLYLSFYGNKLGLFTIGGFTKEIEDLVFEHGVIPLNQLGTADEVTEIFDGLPGSQVIGNTINWTMNNPRKAVLQGIEVEWQSNFWYLPGLLSGLVLNVNFTTQNSEVKYPIVDKSQIIVGYDTTVVFGQTQISPIKETVYTDTFYTDRMIDQANTLLNLSVGYDYKGFSIRASMKYTDNLFRNFHYYAPYREFTKGRYDYDIIVRQKLPVKGLQAYCNITNISKTREITINQGSGWPTNHTYGGLGIAFGLKYIL